MRTTRQLSVHILCLAGQTVLPVSTQSSHPYPTLPPPPLSIWAQRQRWEGILDKKKGSRCSVEFPRIRCPLFTGQPRQIARGGFSVIPNKVTFSICWCPPSCSMHTPPVPGDCIFQFDPPQVAGEGLHCECPLLVGELIPALAGLILLAHHATSRGSSLVNGRFCGQA